MAKSLKEVDEKLKGLREKKKEMLTRKKAYANARKNLVSNRAESRRVINTTRSKLRKQIANINSLLSAGPESVFLAIKEMGDEMHNLTVSLGSFITFRDELNQLDSMLNGDEEEFNEDNF